MSKSNLTLLIDGNWLLMSRMSVLNGKYEDTKDMCNELKVLMVKSINIVLRTFPAIDNVIFVADGGSWRNTVEIPKFLDEEYKGTRIKSDDVDWDTLFESFEDFMAKLASNGITVCKEPGIEGDDWAWYWSKKLNDEGTNVIIWSKDKDLTQLVKTSKDKCFTIWWNKESGILTQAVNEDELNFLFNYEYSVNEEIFNKVISSVKTVTEIDPHEVVIDKIIRGDKGDNILPIIEKKSKTNPEKSFRVYKKDLDFTINIHDEQSVRNYIERILTSKSYVDRVDKSEEDILEHFKYNVKLVELNAINYPPEVLETFARYDTYNCCKDISIAEGEIIAEKSEIKSILDTI